MGIYKTKRIIDGKPPLRTVIVDENGKVINRNPTKEELIGLEIEPRSDQDTRKFRTYTDKELLDYIRQFYKEYGRIPVEVDFNIHPEYPHSTTYWKRFKSWINALKLAGLNVNLNGKQGDNYRSRLAEIKVIDHFKKHPIDLAGENRMSPCDGICPNGKIYDVKSSKFYVDKRHYQFNTHNKYKEEIEIYYLIGLNNDGTIRYVWRIPGEIVEKDLFYVGLSLGYDFNIENMKEYDITDKFKKLLI